jgi:hypothetical protein
VIYYVEVHELRGRPAQDVIVGTISWDGRQLTVSNPNDVGLQSVLAAVVTNPRNHQSVTAQSDPEGWLRGLSRHYRSHALWVTPPKTQ